MDAFMIRHGKKPKPMPLRIAGTATTLTPEPDDAELAAQALLESLIYGDVEDRRQARKTAKPAQGSPEYYKDIANKVKAAHEHEERMAKRAIAYCFDRLLDESLTPDDLVAIERHIYKHQATAERVGGELKARWQHALAEVTVREMKAAAMID